MADNYILNEHNKEEFPPAHTAEHLLNQTMIRLFGCERSYNAHIERKKSKMSFHLRDIFTEEEFQCFEAWSYAWLEKKGEQKQELLTKEKALKNSPFVEQKPAGWSEEDEYCLDGAIETEMYMLDVVNGIKKFDVGNESIKEECTRELNWLKSLKPQSRWRPTKEHLAALEIAIQDIKYEEAPLNKELLADLFVSLKKL